MDQSNAVSTGFCRDRGIPHFFHKVDPKTQAPVRTIWLACFLAFCLALPSLGSSVAFTAATSIATIGLYISYGIPILVGMIWPSNFKKGPFDLGAASRPVGAIACAWIAFILVIFCLPTANPVTTETLNYTAVAVGIVLFGSLISWFLWARRWFTGPVRQVQEVEVDGRIEREVVMTDGMNLVQGQEKVPMGKT